MWWRKARRHLAYWLLSLLIDDEIFVATEAAAERNKYYRKVWIVLSSDNQLLTSWIIAGVRRSDGRLHIKLLRRH